MKIQDSKFNREKLVVALKDVWTTVASGFTLLVVLYAVLLRVGLPGRTSVLGLSFYVAALVFFVIVGALRSLKQLSFLNSTFYRLSHFLLSTGALYLAFYVIQPALSLKLGETKGILDDGSVNWGLVITGLCVFVFCYFVTVGVRVAVASVAHRRALEKSEYEKMVEEKKD